MKDGSKCETKKYLFVTYMFFIARKHPQGNKEFTQVGILNDDDIKPEHRITCFYLSEKDLP